VGSHRNAQRERRTKTQLRGRTTRTRPHLACMSNYPHIAASQGKESVHIGAITRRIRTVVLSNYNFQSSRPRSASYDLSCGMPKDEMPASDVPRSGELRFHESTRSRWSRRCPVAQEFKQGNAPQRRPSPGLLQLSGKPRGTPTPRGLAAMSTLGVITTRRRWRDDEEKGRADQPAMTRRKSPL
jgi:hypothetical protein